MIKEKLWIKICGLARAEDIKACVDAGANALGFLLARSDDGRRNLDQLLVHEARQLIEMVPDSVLTVLVTHAATSSELLELLAAIPAGALQLQSDMGVEEIDRVKDVHPDALLLKKITILNGVEEDCVFRRAAEYVAAESVYACVLDTGNAKGRGGTGKVHDWNVSKKLVQLFPEERFILAGGLNPDNVAAGVEFVRPYGVDAMSGVSISRGIKDTARVRAFIARARQSGSYHRLVN